jgi:hypothetical protein
LTLFPPDAIVAKGFEGTATGPGADVVVLTVIMTVGVVFIPGLRKTSEEIPLRNGFVFTVVSPTSRSTSSLKQKCVSKFHDEIPKTLVAAEAFLGISSVLIPEPTIKKVEISGKHSLTQRSTYFSSD